MQKSAFWPEKWQNPDPLIGECMDAVRSGMKAVENDPLRPRFHFLPPARWMNDVFGATYHNNWYHIFYGLNPFSDQDSEFKCFGHARSRDLIRWQHLPIALAPLQGAGQLRCNDGTITFNAQGEAMLIYTYVPIDASLPRQHWLAYGNADLENWTLYSHNPLLSCENHGGPRFKNSWTDPYVFSTGNRTFMTISKCLPIAGGDGVLPLYESVVPSLTRWRYRGILHDRTGEVVNFFHLQERWVLLYSPFADIQYEIGQFDLETLRFRPSTSGQLSHGYLRQDHPTSRGLYASDVYSAPDGRAILVGWISGFPEGRGWNGCMSLPRVLTIDEQDRLRQDPLPELTKLRGKPVSINNRSLMGDAWSPSIGFSPSSEIEISLRKSPDCQAGFRIFNNHRRSSGIELLWDSSELKINQHHIALDPPGRSELHLHFFIDGALVEVFIDQGRENITQCMALDGTELHIQFFRTKGTAQIRRCTVWPMKSIWTTDARKKFTNDA